MLDEAAGVSRSACAAVVNVHGRALADQVDDQSSDFVSVHIGMVPMAYDSRQSISFIAAVRRGVRLPQVHTIHHWASAPAICKAMSDMRLSHQYREIVRLGEFHKRSD